MKGMLDSKRFENYLRLSSSDGLLGLIPKDSTNIRVFNLEKLPRGLFRA